VAHSFTRYFALFIAGQYKSSPAIIILPIYNAAAVVFAEQLSHSSSGTRFSVLEQQTPVYQ
jgi:hypothetical protein